MGLTLTNSFCAVCQGGIQIIGKNTTQTFECSPPILGQYVIIQFDNEVPFGEWHNIQLCEVEVYRYQGQFKRIV